MIGQEWDNDTRVVLFVILRDGLSLDDDLIDRIRMRMRSIKSSSRLSPSRRMTNSTTRVSLSHSWPITIPSTTSSNCSTWR